MIRLIAFILTLVLVGCSQKSQEQYALEYASSFYPAVGEAINEKIIAASLDSQLDPKEKEKFTDLCKTLGKVKSIDNIKGEVTQFDKDKFLGKYHATADFSGDRRLLVVMIIGQEKEWRLIDFHTNVYEAEWN